MGGIKTNPTFQSRSGESNEKKPLLKYFGVACGKVGGTKNNRERIAVGFIMIDFQGHKNEGGEGWAAGESDREWDPRGMSEAFTFRQTQTEKSKKREEEGEDSVQVLLSN